VSAAAAFSAALASARDDVRRPPSRTPSSPTLHAQSRRSSRGRTFVPPVTPSPASCRVPAPRSTLPPRHLRPRPPPPDPLLRNSATGPPSGARRLAVPSTARRTGARPVLPPPIASPAQSFSFGATYGQTGGAASAPMTAFVRDGAANWVPQSPVLLPSASRPAKATRRRISTKGRMGFELHRDPHGARCWVRTPAAKSVNRMKEVGDSSQDISSTDAKRLRGLARQAAAGLAKGQGTSCCT